MQYKVLFVCHIISSLIFRALAESIAEIKKSQRRTFSDQGQSQLHPDDPHLLLRTG